MRLIAKSGLLIFGIIVIAKAGGPLYKSKDVIAQQEFDNVYQDITNLKNSNLFIKNSNTLQSGATFYVSSGTVGNFTASTITVINRIVIGPSDVLSNKIVVGDPTIALERSVDSVFLNTRNVTDQNYNSAYGSERNAHAFSDSAIVNRSGAPGSGIGYNSFDNRILITGGFDYNHFAGFQSLPVYSSTGATINNYSMFSGITVTTGNITNHYALYAATPVVSGGGIVQNKYGVWITTGMSNFMGDGNIGTVDGTNAPNANWGAIFTGTVGTASSVGPSGQWWDAQSILVPAGDWDITALISYKRNSAPMSDVLVGCGISTTSGNSSDGLTQGVNYFEDSYGVVLTSFTSLGLTVPNYRVNFIGASRLYYLKGIIQTFTSGTPQYSCRISARRASH